MIEESAVLETCLNGVRRVLANVGGDLDLRCVQAVLTVCVGVPALTNNGSCGFPFITRCGFIVIRAVRPPSEGLLQALLVEATLVVQAADCLVLEESGLTMKATM